VASTSLIQLAAVQPGKYLGEFAHVLSGDGKRRAAGEDRLTVQAFVLTQAVGVAGHQPVTCRTLGATGTGAGAGAVKPARNGCK